MRDYFVSLLGETSVAVLQVILTFLAVIVLLAVVVWVVRNFAGGRFASHGGPRAPRLGVIDSVPVDGKRRLVLVRRDQFEHLLLIGGPTDLVVEETIYRGVPLANYPRNDARPAAGPAVQGGGQSALRDRGTSALSQGDGAGEAPALAPSPARRPAAEEPATGSETTPSAPETMAGPQSLAERRAADSPMRVNSSLEPHGEVPVASIDRQSRAASFATRFQSGFGRGSVTRRSQRENHSAEIQPLAQANGEPFAAPGSPPPPTALAAVAAAISVVPDEPSGSVSAARSEVTESDWITPAFADALEPRQAIAANDPTASIDDPPAEEMLPRVSAVAAEPSAAAQPEPAQPELAQPEPPPPVEFAPRAARRATQANLEQEMARLLGEIASKRSR
jgi:flagellar biogenesis protein FliO